MFSTLESAWDHSARRGWSTLASFGFQALALSLLLAVPVVWVQGPPQARFLDSLLAPPPPAPAPAPRVPEGRHPTPSTNMSGTQIVQPPTIPDRVVIVNDHGVSPAPDLGNEGVPGGIGSARRGIAHSFGDNVAVAPPPPPVNQTPRLRVSHWAEGNLIHRVQPVYPVIARTAGVQGAVILRAVVSKTGTIEQLTVVSGSPLLIKAALEAVRQWRYRPYLLNDEPIEIDTEITVNFVLSR
ncbi:MAG TPA: energy transducer TonB [Terriglobales bacterium]|nr:energy transducer TonB [Terriglobales bacterium]